MKHLTTSICHLCVCVCNGSIHGNVLFLMADTEISYFLRIFNYFFCNIKNCHIIFTIPMQISFCMNIMILKS
jgi:hypothetical protein